MKNTLGQKTILLIMCCLIITACKSPTEQLQDAATSTIESVAETQSGQSIDLPDGDSYEKNSTSGSLSIAGKEYMNSSIKLVANIAGQRDENGKTVSIQLITETGTTLMVVISKYPDKINVPFTCKLYKEGEEPSDKTFAKVVFMSLSENSMESFLSFDGELKITKMTNDEVAFSIDGKTGSLSNLENASKWIDLKAQFLIKSPLVMTVGMQKEDILQ